MSRAAVRILKRRWGLPDAATPALERFFTAWAAGHTSVELSEEEAGVLASSAAVTDGSEGAAPAPLVLRGGRLQSWRLDRAETRVAARLRELAREDVPATSPPDGGEDLAQLFSDPRSAQRRAAELGLRRALALVTGGPGTGKTTTAARLLALLAHRERGIRVALAAPTGKAAARMGEAIGEAARALDGPLAAVHPRLERAAGRARTLHRLLGWNPRADRCRFHAGNPLPADLVVVDEASMLDLVLWDRVLAAVGRDTRLVVLGDHRQLESVQPGRVLRDMVVAADGGALDACHVELDRNYRFESHPGISKPRGRGPPVRRRCRCRDPHRCRVPGRGGPPRVGRGGRRTRPDLAGGHGGGPGRVTRRGAGGTPGRAHPLRLRRGPYGVEGINARVEARLRSEGLPAGEWAPGRPVLVTANDPTADSSTAMSAC